LVFVTEPVLVPEPAPHVSRMNIANVLTVFRIVLVPVLAWAILAHSGQSILWRLVAVGIFLVAAITDKIDGNLARSRGLITDLGKLLDPIADKALMGVALLLLWRPLRELPLWVPVIVLVRELGITWMRMALLRLGTVMPASRGGKIKTVLQSIAIPFFLLPLTQWINRGILPSWVHTIAWIVMIATVAWTLITGIDYAIQGWRIARDARAGRQTVVE